ncbi:MAG TPA: GH92 family glycosyl hydrolase, partial [Bryobacteraceae bacterium]
MISRRQFVGVASGLSSAALANPAKLLGQTPALQGNSSSAADHTQYVKLSIGTGGHGHTYPGATVPFGMVQLSPDTYTKGWDWCSGYHNSDRSLMGFSHTHLSGTGIGDLLDFLIMPGTGSPKLSPGTRENPDAGYRSRFSHDDEVARPGYYSVLLRDYNVRAELSATERAGIHRYAFPKSDTSHFILDLTHVSGGNPQTVAWSQLKVIGNDTLAGARRTSGWARGREVFFYMKFSKPFSRAELLSNDHVVTGVTDTTGTSLKSLVHFNTTDTEPVLVKTGISGASIEGAQRNLEAEIPDWNFDAISHSAQAAWQRELSKIQIETSNRMHREIFYTALYHTMCAPTLFDDVDGQYRGMDGVNHQLKNGGHNYSTFSLWDTYRAAHPLYTLFQSERVPDLVNCLIRMSIESPAGVPVWPLYAKETGTMSGYHSVVVIAEAIAKGFQGIDAAAAYGPMKRRVMHDDYRGLNLYRKFGYIPCDREEESVSRSLDYAYDDWAVARV